LEQHSALSGDDGGFEATAADLRPPDDDARALTPVTERGILGKECNIGARNEPTNIQLPQLLCTSRDEIEIAVGGGRERLFVFVSDRTGHDRRNAIDPSKIERELGWTASTALRKIVTWYVKISAMVAVDSRTRLQSRAHRAG
jgi:dTDP-D-glucose 4,6-dehydratase